ncbi:MAG: hypothetical protein F3745_00325 [Nitrospinae bacterium]|nr:hypothetical protein [Nitrospinota bacterium]
MSESQVVVDPSLLTGAQPKDVYSGIRIKQGNRIHYLLAVPLHQVEVMLPVPDPKVIAEDNRELKVKHAEDFALYIKENIGWHSGPLTVRTSSTVCDFTPFVGMPEDHPSMPGYLSVPRVARDAFRIVDGQHRTYGIQKLLEDLNNDLISVRQKIYDAEQRGETSQLINEFKKQEKSLTDIQKRLEKESVVIDLIIEDDQTAARQVFVDVADNAEGIKKTIVNRFDQRKVVNRALKTMMLPENIHALLKDRVDNQQDTVTGKNENFIAASKVAQILQEVNAESGMRKFSKKFEEEALTDPSIEQGLITKTETFFSLLLENFDILQEMVEGNISAADVRRQSMIGSITMQRVLAGVYKSLLDDGHSTVVIGELFSQISKHCAIPIEAGTTSGDLWLGKNQNLTGVQTEVFSDGAKAPSARAQTVKALIERIAGWVGNPPAAL